MSETTPQDPLVARALAAHASHQDAEKRRHERDHELFLYGETEIAPPAKYTGGGWMGACERFFKMLCTGLPQASMEIIDVPAVPIRDAWARVRLRSHPDAGDIELMLEGRAHEVNLGATGVVMSASAVFTADLIVWQHPSVSAGRPMYRRRMSELGFPQWSDLAGFGRQLAEVENITIGKMLVTPPGPPVKVLRRVEMA